MAYPVRYRCPRCETIATVERSGSLADRSVTPFPLTGWSYGAPGGDVPYSGVDGIRFVCGRDEAVDWAGEGCGEPFYLSFVRYSDGERVPVRPESEYVRIGTGPPAPRSPPRPGR